MYIAKISIVWGRLLSRPTRPTTSLCNQKHHGWFRNVTVKYSLDSLHATAYIASMIIFSIYLGLSKVGRTSWLHSYFQSAEGTQMHPCHQILWISIQEKWREKRAGKNGFNTATQDWSSRPKNSMTVTAKSAEIENMTSLEMNILWNTA